MLRKAIDRTPTWALVTSVVGVVTAGLLALAIFGSDALPDRVGPPVEELGVERTVLEPGTIELTVRNDGPDPVTVAQVFVNDSYVDFTGGDEPIERLRTSTLEIDYPWLTGQPYAVSMLTSTGLVIEHSIPAAVETPDVDSTSIGRMALLGTFIGVVPVLLGMTVLPILRRTGPQVVRILLAVTVGLLGFLAVDAALEGFDVSGAGGTAFGGDAIVVLGAVLAYLVLAAIGRLPRARNAAGVVSLQADRNRLALLVAIGIGAHNLGEGLAVGSAFAVGELALGTALVVGFAVHNVTEGVAVVAPLSPRPVGTTRLLALGLVAGAPAIVGTVVGSVAVTPAQTAFLLGVGVGAIAQVVVHIAPRLRRDDGALDAPVIGGLAGGVLVMYLTGLFAVT